MVQGVIFDMDGLMFDSERLGLEVWISVFEKAGYKFTPDVGSSIRGRNDQDIHAILREKYGEQLPSEELHKQVWQQLNHRMKTEGVAVKQGLYELLDWLKQNRIPCALASSSRKATVEWRCREAGVWENFQAIVCGDMVTHSKPNPEIFLTAAKALNLAPENCMVLEDSFNGVRAGHTGGFITVMVPDLDQPTPEIQALYTAKAESLLDVRDRLAAGEWN